MKKIFIAFGIGLILLTVGYFGYKNNEGSIKKALTFGAFGDPFISLQLATDPDNGECLTTDGTENIWSSSCGSGSGTPGGSDTQVQFNDAGSFNGATGLTYDKTTRDLAYDGDTTGAFSLLTDGGAGEFTLNSAGQFTLNGTLTQLSGGTGIKIFDTVSGFSAFASTSLLSADRTFQFPNVSGTLCVVGQTCDGSGGSGSDPFYHPAANQSATTTLTLFFGNASTTHFTSTSSTYLATESGNVGLGTTNPTAKLDVVGGIYATASSTFAGDVQLPGLTQGFAYTGTNGKVNTIASSSINLSWFNNDTGFRTFAWPFDANTGYVSTTTTLGLLNGFFSTASSTQIGDFRQTNGYSMFGTTTNTLIAQTTIASSTAHQLALSAGVGIAQWALRNAGGNLYFATTTVAGEATTSISALEISGSGFGTTTLRGLNISGQATSTSNVGFNITTGCYAISGTCISGSGGGSGLTSYDAWTHTLFGGQAGGNFYSATTSMMAIGTSTAANNIATLTVSSSTASQLALADGLGTASWVVRNAGGNFYLSTTTVAGTATTSVAALQIDGASGTTTVRGLNISAQATSTSNVGFNLTGGCFAINGTCLSGSGSSLTGGRSITISGSAIDADAELYTVEKSVVLFASSTANGISTTTENFISFKVANASTITNFSCYAQETGSSTIKASVSTDGLTAGTNILYTTGTRCGAANQVSTSTFSSTAVPAGSWIHVWVSDASPTGSRPNRIFTSFTMTKDD